MAEKLQLTSEQIQDIMNLPEKEFNISGTKTRGKYDAVTSTFYPLNEKGELQNRKVKIATKPTGQEKPEKPTAFADTLRKMADATEDKSETKKKTPEEKANKSKKSKTLLAVVLIIAVLAVVALSFENIINAYRSFVGLDPLQKDKGSVTPLESEQNEEINLSFEEMFGEDIKVDLSSIVVIQSTKNLLPGMKIERDNIQPLKLSAESYNILSQNNLIYTYEQKESVIGSVASQYVKAGQIITANNTAAIFPVAKNPLSAGAGMSKIEMPSPPNNGLYYGSIFTVSVVPDYAKDAPIEVSNAVVMDMLDADLNSLYDKYYQIYKLPEGERENFVKNLSPEEIKNYNAEYIVFAVSDKIAKSLNINFLDCGISYDYSGTYEQNTEYTDFYNAAKDICNYIVTYSQTEQEEAQQ